MRKAKQIGLYVLVLVGLCGLAVSYGRRALAQEPFPFPTQVVAQQSFLNQTTAIPDTVLFTPAADGDFRLSAYEEASDACLSIIDVGFQWTDTLRTNRQRILTCGGGGQSYYPVHVQAGQAMVIFVHTSPATVPPYNVYFTVEQLTP